MTVFLDTNVLLYSAAPAEHEDRKHELAAALIDQGDCALSIQVLNEFVHQSTRPKRPSSLTREQALGFVRAWRRFPVQPLDLALFDRAVEVGRRTNYTWWDCLIVAAAIGSGCDTLATEDLEHGRVIDGLRIENPFRDVA